MRKIVSLLTISLLISLSSYHAVYADGQDKLDFAAGLEEALGHFYAIELNLDAGDGTLAKTHALHPISELYDAMKPQLQAESPAFDSQFQSTLTALSETASVDVSRTQAQAALDDAKDLIEQARTLVVGDALSDDYHFKLLLMKTLLETSSAEYGEAVSDGMVVEMAEFQDGSAFVWRSQQILNEIKDDISMDAVDDIESAYMSLNDAYDQRVDPPVVAGIVDDILGQIDDIAEAEADERLSFAAGLEEAIGHFHAIEHNLDERNGVLAETHALHPIAELYDAMKPQLQAADPGFDRSFKTMLDGLRNAASVNVPLMQAKNALDNARAQVEDARMLVVGEFLSDDRDFKLGLMKTLLETASAEYGEAVSDGVVVEMAEFQDGSAFVWRSQQIFDEIMADVESVDYDSIQSSFMELDEAFDDLVDPPQVAMTVSDLISKIDSITQKDLREKLDFAAGLEEAIGHFHAIELNLNERNGVLAAVHATHPIAELYDAMKPQLEEADPEFDAKFHTMLTNLKDTASVDVSMTQAKRALNDARSLVEEARLLVVGDALSDDRDFKLRLMKTLLETSSAEYGEAVSDGMVVEMAEFQDGSAFVWRSQQIFEEVRADLSMDDVTNIADIYDELNTAYDDKLVHSEVAALTNGIISRIDAITGDSSAGLSDHIGAIRTLLADARSEYASGNTDLALSYATKAYLDHFEFLEAPLIQADERDFMVEVEELMRQQLRTSIKEGASTFHVSSLIDTVLTHVDTVESILIDEN